MNLLFFCLTFFFALQETNATLVMQNKLHIEQGYVMEETAQGVFEAIRDGSIPSPQDAISKTLLKINGDAGETIDFSNTSDQVQAFRDIINEEAEGKVSGILRIQEMEQADYEYTKSVVRTAVENRVMEDGGTIHMYLSSPESSALANHTDTTDIFVLQLVGAKEWILCDNQAPRLLDKMLRRKLDKCTTYTATEMDSLFCERITLYPGDALYLPKKVVHSARATSDGLSAHLTFGFAENTCSIHAMDRCVSPRVDDHDQGRRRLACNRLEGGINCNGSCNTNCDESCDFFDLCCDTGCDENCNMFCNEGCPTPPPTPPPTPEPTLEPSSRPTAVPSSPPTPGPTREPTPPPTPGPTSAPTPPPTPGPTSAPTPLPTPGPTSAPTAPPSLLSSSQPSSQPTSGPTSFLTESPTPKQSPGPSALPTPSPTARISSSPTRTQSIVSTSPSQSHSEIPSRTPTQEPSNFPTAIEITAAPAATISAAMLFGTVGGVVAVLLLLLYVFCRKRSREALKTSVEVLRRGDGTIMVLKTTKYKGRSRDHLETLDFPNESVANENGYFLIPVDKPVQLTMQQTPPRSPTQSLTAENIPMAAISLEDHSEVGITVPVDSSETLVGDILTVGTTATAATASGDSQRSADKSTKEAARRSRSSSHRPAGSVATSPMRVSRRLVRDSKAKKASRRDNTSLPLAPGAFASAEDANHSRISRKASRNSSRRGSGSRSPRRSRQSEGRHRRSSVPSTPEAPPQESSMRSGNRSSTSRSPRSIALSPANQSSRSDGRSSAARSSRSDGRSPSSRSSRSGRRSSTSRTSTRSHGRSGRKVLSSSEVKDISPPDLAVGSA
ncbi:MAG: hypothetical protein SGBAC_011617 [Bacillariaceae sp.]